MEDASAVRLALDKLGKPMSADLPGGIVEQGLSDQPDAGALGS